MSDPDRRCEVVPRDVDIRAWVEAARRNPSLYRDRQVTEIVLAAIGLAPSLRTSLVLKGGTLMALAFRSDRVTTDVDFSSDASPGDFSERLVTELDRALPRAAAALGHARLVCRVQSVVKKPRPQNFENLFFPALHVRVGSAERGTPQERALIEGRANRVLQLEITFRDQVHVFEEINLLGANVAIQAFAITEIIAEKLRALLQQPVRKRNRRQDVFDIAFLLERHELDGDDKKIIHRTLVEKCGSRGIIPKQDDFARDEIKNRAGTDWETLRLEVTNLPSFEERYAIVRSFYEGLPWQA